MKTGESEGTPNMLIIGFCNLFLVWCYFSLFSKLMVPILYFSEFPTNRTELNAVFDIFDRDGSGEIDYKEFIDALKPERHVSTYSLALSHVHAPMYDVLKLKPLYRITLGWNVCFIDRMLYLHNVYSHCPIC